MDDNALSDPFVHIVHTPESNGASDIKAKTKIIYRTRFPIWDENFKFDVEGPLDTLHFDVKDDDLSKVHVIFCPVRHSLYPLGRH